MNRRSCHSIYVCSNRQRVNLEHVRPTRDNSLEQCAVASVCHVYCPPVPHRALRAPCGGVLDDHPATPYGSTSVTAR